MTRYTIEPTNVEQLYTQSQSQSQEKEKYQKKAPAPPALDPNFISFWQTYPLKIGKLAAAKSYAKATNGSDTTPELILAAVVKYRDNPSRDPKFTAHPATWLNQGRWTDEPTEMAKPVRPPLW